MAFLSDSHFSNSAHHAQIHDEAPHWRPNWSLFAAVSLNAAAWVVIMWAGVRLI